MQSRSRADPPGTTNNKPDTETSGSLICHCYDDLKKKLSDSSKFLKERDRRPLIKIQDRKTRSVSTYGSCSYWPSRLWSDPMFYVAYAGHDLVEVGVGNDEHSDWENAAKTFQEMQRDINDKALSDSIDDGE